MKNISLMARTQYQNLTMGTHLTSEPNLEKKKKNEIVETKRPWPKNKKAAMLGLAHEVNEKLTGKKI